MDNQNLVPVEMLESGDWAEIADISGEPGWLSRLAELGIRTGSRLRMLRPGTPCVLEVAGTRLSVRPDVATQILVRPQCCFA